MESDPDAPAVEIESIPTGQPTVEDDRIIEGGLEGGNGGREQPVADTGLSGGLIATLVGIGVGASGLLALAYGQKRRRDRRGIPLY